MTNTDPTATRRWSSVMGVLAALTIGLAAGIPAALAHHTKPHQAAVAEAKAALFEQRNAQSVKRLLEGIWSNPASDAETPYLLGLAHVLLFDPDKALAMFESCLANEARAPEPSRRTDCLYWTGRAYALKAAWVWYYRESMLEGLIKSRRAIQAALDRYEQVLKRTPDHAGVLLSQAEYYMTAPYVPPLAYGDLAMARTLVERVLALSPENPRALFLQARLDLYYNGRRDKARAGLGRVRQLLEQGVGGADALLLHRWLDFAQAEAAFLDHDFTGAIAYADAYLRQVPDGAEAYALKGASLKFLGQQAAGEALIQKARDFNPRVRRYREP